MVKYSRGIFQVEIFHGKAFSSGVFSLRWYFLEVFSTEGAFPVGAGCPLITFDLLKGH